MTAPADLVVTQLSVEAGEAQESADFITVARPAGLWPLRRRTDQFCALLAPDRPGQGPLCRQVLDVMEREFASSGGRSATSALAAVLLAAHQFLRRENSLSMPEDRVRLQVAAAVLRSGGAYLGRVGATFAAVRHQGALQRFLGAPSANGTAEPADQRLLGGEFDPQIAYAFSPFVPDDLLILASGSQWERTRADYIEAATEEGEPSAVASALYELGVWRQTRPTFSILVVEARTPERRGWIPRESTTVEEEVETEDYVDVAPRRQRQPVDRGYRSTRAPGRTRYGEHRDYGNTDYRDDRDLVPAPAESGARRRPRRPGAGGYARGDQPPPQDIAGHARAAWGQFTHVTMATVPPRALLVGLMALALVVLVVLGFALVQILRPPRDDAAAFAAQAQSLYDQVRKAPDAPTARTQLDQARDLLARALALREDPPRRSLLRDIQAELDRVDRVVRLPTTTPLIDLSGLGADTSVTRVITEGTDLYLLDVGGARLLRYQLQADGTLQSPDPTTIVKRGDQVTGRAVGGLITMAWVPTGGPRTDPGLVLVESGRTFLTYNPRAGLGRVVPAESVRWNAVVAMAGSRGSVYLVDPDRRTVVEYRPTLNGYDSPPFAVLDPSRGGSDVAWDRVLDIGVEGNSLYLLQGDGVLRKYDREKGEPQPFAGQAPDGLRGPISLAVAGSGDARPLYVADMGNDRVVQFAPDGVYQRQFRPPADSGTFQGLRDVTVDANNRLYVLTAKGLYRYDIPAEP